MLFDIEEEEKEDHLPYHSERLAIAFALMECRSDSPIRIIPRIFEYVVIVMILQNLFQGYMEESL